MQEADRNKDSLQGFKGMEQNNKHQFKLDLFIQSIYIATNHTFMTWWLTIKQ